MILNEAIRERVKECSGDHLKWDNCVAFRENYLGEYKDGYVRSQYCSDPKFLYRQLC